MGLAVSYGFLFEVLEIYIPSISAFRTKTSACLICGIKSGFPSIRRNARRHNTGRVGLSRLKVGPFGYFPRNAGLRFSMNAVRPSL